VLAFKLATSFLKTMMKNAIFDLTGSTFTNNRLWFFGEVIWM